MSGIIKNFRGCVLLLVSLTTPLQAQPQPPGGVQVTPSYPIRASPPTNNKYLALEAELRPTRPPTDAQSVTLVYDVTQGGRFTNEWVVSVPGGVEEARKVAEVLGHEFLREVHGFPNHFIMKKKDHSERNHWHSDEITSQLLQHVAVDDANQQTVTHPESRSVLPLDEPTFSTPKTFNDLIGSNEKPHGIPALPASSIGNTFVNEPTSINLERRSTDGDELIASGQRPKTATAEVLEATVELSEISQQDEEEKEKNRINEERTREILTDKKEKELNELVTLIKASGQSVKPVIDLVEKTARNIGGVNAMQTRNDILRLLQELLLEQSHQPSTDNQIIPENGHATRRDAVVKYDGVESFNNDQVKGKDGVLNMMQESLMQQLYYLMGKVTGLTGHQRINEERDHNPSIKVSDVIVTPTSSVEDLRRHLTEETLHVSEEMDEPDTELMDRAREVLRRGQGEAVDVTDGPIEASAGEEGVQGQIAQLVTDTLQIGSDSSFGESRYLPLFNDEQFLSQWYVQDFRSGADLTEKPINDLNVIPVYIRYRLSGLGVRVVVPDDGLEHSHEDLRDNYDPSISYDLNSNDGDPSPRMTNPPRNVHGTRCAGEIAMVANNRKCGAGIAFRAKVGGIRMLDGVSTDRVEGEALKFKHYWVDIYSNSWGPKDDGQTLDLLGKMTTHALVDGITESRGGRGALYVFAAGNGKPKGDNCACDGYVSSIFTIAIATCDRYGHVSPHSERCSATIATAFSAGLDGHNVVTTDVNNSCTQSHTGTSAAAPLVAGILALLLEARPDITWRDAQHLIIWTSEVAPLADNYGWNVNGFGFLVSQDFGFGMVNAYNLITAAQTWENVPESHICAVPVDIGDNSVLRSNIASQFDILTDACQGSADGEINYLEHVQLNVDIAYPARGDLQIVLYSPMGTRSHLLEARPLDKSSYGFPGWTFSSLHSWGENPRGLWIVQIFDVGGNKTDTGIIHKLKLILHGTLEPPAHYKNGSRSYDPFDLKE